MRGKRIHSRARRRVRNHASRAVDRFEHRILADGVYDDVLEDTQLAHLEDAVAKIEDARDRRREELADELDADPSSGIADAVEQLQKPIADRINEVCAERCRAVIVDGDEWVAEGWEDADDVAAAKEEARRWLQDNIDAAERAGVLEAL